MSTEPGPSMLPDFTGYTFVSADGTILNPLGKPVAAIAPTHDGILFGYALANLFANPALVRTAPRLLANLKTMTELAERYRAGEPCDGNFIEPGEVIAEAERPVDDALTRQSLALTFSSRLPGGGAA